MTSPSLVQRIVRALAPAATFAQIEAQSRRWHLVCPRCGWKRSYWAAGGLRFKAASRGKPTPGRCPGCGNWVGFRTEWIEDGAAG